MTESEFTELKEVIRFVAKLPIVTSQDLQIQFVKGYCWANKMVDKLVELKVISPYALYHLRNVIVKPLEAEVIISNLKEPR